jgi:tellurite resistance protein TerC
MESIGSPQLWIGFTAFVVGMLALDLGVFHKTDHKIEYKEALGWSVFWISLALIFNLGVYHWFGKDKAVEFLTGYLIEKTLSVDNIFIFVIIFSSFAVPDKYQHRVLFWGVLGALVMRAIFIFAGAALLMKFHWMMYVFGAFLIITGIKLLINRNKVEEPEKNIIFRFCAKFIPTVPEYHGSKFTIVKEGKRYGTPLLMVLLAIEITDLIFAIDSIPAIFAITNDPFIVYTSNIFAILGLRSLYFLLAGVVHKVRYLKVGLAVVLLFVGVKMALINIYKIPIGFSLLFISVAIGASVAASLLIKPEK